jgi:hypothetical protein
VTEAISGEQLFDDLTKRIKNIASKMDLILFSVPRTKDETKELAEDVLTLQCFYLGVYQRPSEILEKFLDRLEQAQTTEQKKSKKQTASFFTPPFIAEYMVQATIGPLVDKLFKGRKPTRPETKINRLLRLRICDPAVGGGIFLVCAHDYLMTKILEAKPDADLKEMSRKSAKCLFGVDINPEAVEGCKLALHLNIAKWSLKKQILEFANIAEQPLSSPSDSSGNSEKQSSAQEPAPESTNTAKTTQASGAKRIAKSVLWPFAWRIGTKASASAQRNAPLAHALATQMALIKKQKRSSSEWLQTLPIGSGSSQKPRATDQSMASTGVTSFKSFYFLWSRVRQLSLSTYFTELFVKSINAASRARTTSSKFSAATSYLRPFAITAARCLSMSLPNISPTLGESPRRMNTSLPACISSASTKAKSLSMWAELGARSLASFGSGWASRGALKICEASA